MLHAVTWKWRQEYCHSFLSEYANVLERMVRRHYDGDLRFVTVTDDPVGVDGETFPLWPDCSDLKDASQTGSGDRPWCYRRLKLFDPDQQRAMGIQPGDRIVSLDLDTVVVGDLNTLWDRNEAFVGWRVSNRATGYSYNGAMWMLRAGEYPDVWSSFDPATSPQRALRAGYLGDDQAWLSLVLGQDRAAWTKADGIYTRKETMTIGESAPPTDATIVMFHGRVKPWDAIAGEGPAWVSRYWR